LLASAKGFRSIISRKKDFDSRNKERTETN
jgi:hypothetical protein